MWIPHTVPELILRVYTRKLTPEQLEQERKRRSLRSEDTTWDAALPSVSTTLVGFSIKAIADSYPELVGKVDAANASYKAKFNATKKEWEAQWAAYRKDKRDYDRQ